jgi:predicted lipoprotein with Yx(FWY)xxD motif
LARVRAREQDAPPAREDRDGRDRAGDASTSVQEVTSMRAAIGLSAVLLALSAATSFAAEPAMEMDSSMGKILVDEKKMTLYTFDKDETNKSNCYDQCAVNWPPFMAAAGAMADGEWTIVERTDGSKQWAYKGKPLYLWVQDKAPGDMTGEGKGNGTWHVAMAQ